ncbi:MAG TPA: hypothetical protein VLG41_21810, partial [Hydrogenophaga sp.]|uniref:RIFT barrel domain-containing protein n=1 Tax=Hydrogenophaga sp. TaxID=1904254 RepID=UPI002C9F5930
PTPTPPAPAPTPVPPPPPAPAVGVGGLACASGAITCVEVTSSSAQTNLPITFGQPFRSGDLATSQGLRAQDSAGNTVPLQMDEVSTHTNGSVRFAVLSASVPSLPANTARIINIYPATKTTPSVSLPASPAWNLQVTARLSDGSTLVANPQQALQQAIAAGNNRRLHGPVASEFNIVAPMVNQSTGAAHPHLVARLHTRLYQSGQIRTDVVMENNWALKASPSDLSYSLTVTANGQTLLSQPSFTHHHKARWHKVVWTGAAAPNVRVRHNMRYFLDSRATWNYNLGLTIPESVLAAEASSLASRNTGPMGTAMLTTDMPGTGGRSEIAPVPRWTAMYLISQDDRARASMLANADAAASAPVHYRDEATDQPISVIKYPNIALRYGTSSPSVPTASTSSTWKPDIAHQGSYAYIPYLITGDAFYLDEMMFWAAWNIAANDPAGRGTSQGHMGSEQLRGAAWGFRSILEAAFALPDNHPQKTYFRTIANNNISFFNSNFTATTDTQYVFPLGGLKGIYNNNQIPGYENDFFMYVTAWALENGETGMQATFNNIARYIVGRFTSAVQAQGFCTSKGAHYWNESRSGGSALSTWAAYANANGDGPSCGTLANGDGAYPDWAGGYAAVSRGMLGAAANAGHTDAPAAYTRWLTFTPNLGTDFKNDPSYAIVPR